MLTQLPTELWTEVASSLDLAALRILSTLNHTVRDITLPFLFRAIRYNEGNVCKKLQSLNSANVTVKSLIRALYVVHKCSSGNGNDSPTPLYLLLPTLPNLQVFAYEQIEHLIPATHICDLMSALEKTHIQELCLDFYTLHSKPLVGRAAKGQSGLTRLSIKWELDNDADEPDRGSYLRQLEALILPSLKTLVDLTIFNVPFTDEKAADLDLLLLRDAGPTLRRFDYTLRSVDDGILETIPAIFPHLEKLAVRWSPKYGPDSIPWKSHHMRHLAKNQNLVQLTLSSDFELLSNDVVRRDNHVPWLIRCYTRRLEATRALCEAIPRLRQCDWVQYHAEVRQSPLFTALHQFVIEERGDQQGTERVARGVQQWWMGGKRGEPPMRGSKRSFCTDARLESLPGDIIGKNDDEE